MHLKRLEAYGFKSFADKLQLDFTTGVTCIVGPNGCGKSNVCDAIKWVLGEQNARNIRSGGQGKTMQEVIFKGTNNRKPMGYCEVSLVFDNTDRAYKIDFDELIITRKLFRSGDSEYYINGKRAKLKDIIDLFRDTGIGKDGYSVVGQGQIDAILSAKPEDRRQIFEEAAGISKYKANRKEAFTRLERAILNIRSLEEQMRVLEDVIKPLRVQAEVAAKARSLNDRIRLLDINHFLYVSDHSEEQRKKLREKLTRETAELDEVTKKQADVNKEYTAAQEQLNSLDEVYKQLNAKKLQLSVEEASRKKDGEHFSETLKKVTSDIERYTEDIANKTKQLEINRSFVDECTKESEAKTKEHFEAKCDEQNAIEKYTALSDAVAVKQNEINLTNQALLSAADKTGAINADIAMLTAQKTALEENIERRNGEIAEHKEEIKKCAKEVASAEEIIAQKTQEIEKKFGEQKKLQEQYNEVSTKLIDAEDKYRESYGTIANLKGRLNLLESRKNNFSNYDNPVKFLMTHPDPIVHQKVCGVLGELIKVISPKFATAVDIALGNNINNMITETAEDAGYLIDLLKRANAGRGTFLPLDMMRPKPLDPLYETALEEDGCYGLAMDLIRCDAKYRPALETLLGKVVVAEDKEAATRIARKYRNGFRIVTLDGENFAISGAISGGSRSQNESQILSLENDIAEVNRQLKVRMREYEMLSKDINEVREAKQEMTTAISVIGNIIVKLRGEKEAAEKQKMFSAQTKARYEFEIEKLISENNADKQAVSEKNAILLVQSQETDTQSQARSGSTDTLTQLADELNSLKRELAAADENRTVLLTKTKSLEMELAGLKTSLQTAQKNIDRLTKEIMDENILLDQRTRERETLLEEINRIASLAGESEELKAVTQEINKLDSQKFELNTLLDKSYKDSQTLGEEISRVSDRKARTETQLENIDTEIATLQNNIQESYQLSVEEASAFRMEDYSDTSGMTENKVLKRELAALGPINETAEEMLKERQQEYDEKKVHYDDVVEAKRMLDDTIKDLTDKMESIFTESFEQIKKNFSEIFNLLFDGGKGRLDLDIMPGQSVLDAGIVIEAEPPGKKLQNITLLSGGERALTAIAIIFAIIKLHPMPFCVLDEVDAPLDDSNASIYARFLQKYSKNTQFIIISHRKPTMELADELYGITMQEQGVSKHLSIKLSDALKMAHKGGN